MNPNPKNDLFKLEFKSKIYLIVFKMNKPHLRLQSFQGVYAKLSFCPISVLSGF